MRRFNKILLFFFSAIVCSILFAMVDPKALLLFAIRAYPYLRLGIVESVLSFFLIVMLHR